MKHIIVGFSLVCCFTACQNNSNSIQDMPRLRDSINQLHVTIDEINKNSKELKDSLTYWHIYSKPQAILKEKGIRNPRLFVSENLLSQTQLIPYKAILGGTMMIQRVSLLGDHWAIASFEDGHIGGDLLLSYSVKDTFIYWKVLDANLND